MSARTKVILYGDVSPNIIDGSSIWLVSMAETLSSIFDEVHVQLKDAVRDRRLHDRLASLTGVSTHEHSSSKDHPELSPQAAAETIAARVQEIDPSAVVIRGSAVCAAAVEFPEIGRRLWAYVTDLPFPPSTVTETKLRDLSRIAAESHRVFAQTEAARSYFEGFVPEASGKCILLTPMVPDEFFEDSGAPRSSGESPIELVYSGKFASAWLTLEMLDLPLQLRDYGIDARLTVIGDKFQKDRADRTWHQRMQAALEAAHADPDSGVEWVGGKSRNEALEYVSRADFGLGWRTEELNSSLELSTKMLEYCASGTPPIINRNDIHVDLLGSSYPLMLQASTDRDVAEVLRTHQAQGSSELSDEVRELARDYSVSRSAERLRRAFERGGAIPSEAAGSTALEASEGTSGGGRPRRVLVASHDFKFMGEILSQLRTDPDVEVRIDHWDTLHTHDEDVSRELLGWADTILCEWCGPNAVWYSQNKLDHQRLVVRLHRFEVNGEWMPSLETEKVDLMIYVSDFQRGQSEAALAQLQLVPSSVIVNAIDAVDLDRPKLTGAEFHIGVLGIVPFVKRPDRAVELLERLLEHDDRYVLHLRGRLPWEYPHEWKKNLQQQIYLDFFRRIRESSALRSSIVFEPFGADVGSWFRKIGAILSPSSFESFHLATAEGMASGSLPIVWARDGATEIFGQANVYDDCSAMADRILEIRDPQVRARSSQTAKSTARAWDIVEVYAHWKTALV